MIKLERVVLASPEQMEFIIEGMRNPHNSWDKSDSGYYNQCDECCSLYDFLIGTNDHSLMQRLANAGTDHRKFMRMIPVYVRITAPLYWWKEFDTYKVGTVANSCSTMHKIQENEFMLLDFSHDHMTPYSLIILEDTINALNELRAFYLNWDSINDATRKVNEWNEKKDIWWQMIQLLPSSYNQTRNVMINYEVLANIYKSRRNHKLDEWREFCKWIEELPYSELITGVYNKDLVEVTRCKDCQLYISAENMKKDPEYKKYDNKLGHDGLCEGTDKWTDETDYCSCGKNKED